MPDIQFINFELADYQQELASQARRFIADRAGLPSTRSLMEGQQKFDPGVYRQLAAELGAVGLHLAEDHGGAGAGFVEVGLMLYELGRACYPGPYLPSVIALELLTVVGDEAVLSEHGPALAAGDRTATVAWAEAAGPGVLQDIATTARSFDGGWQLRGTKRLVINGDSASLLLVPARTDRGTSLFLVDGSGPGVTRTARPTLDQTRALADISFTDASASLVGRDGQAQESLATGFDRACVALAAETIGVADAILEMTVAYLKAREQFGRPIGSFQALKHRCADLVMMIELARVAVDYGVRAIDGGADDVRQASAIALAEAADAAVRAADESIQMHGGIGFTWEHDAHVYLKRARANAALFGLPADHRERLLTSIGV